MVNTLVAALGEIITLYERGESIARAKMVHDNALKEAGLWPQK